MKIDYETAMAMLPGVNAQLAAAAGRYSEAYEQALLALRRVQAIMAGEGGEVASLRKKATDLQAVIDRGLQGEVIELAMVENPMITDGLIEDGSGQKLVQVSRNMALLVGGLARITDRTEEQTLAAAKFRGLHERAQLGGAKAQDYGKLKVDSSGASEELVSEIGAQARKEYADAVAVLGMVRSSLVEKVVVYDGSLRELATSMGLSETGAGRKRAKHALFDGLNALVDHFGVRAGAGARPRPRVWRDERHTGPFAAAS